MRLLRRKFRPYQEIRSPTLEMLTLAMSAHAHEVVSETPDADIYNLHWNKDFIDYNAFFKYLQMQNPLFGECLT